VPLPIVPWRDNNEGNLLINEIFYSIQGESSFAGLPCAFIRLTGCNLRCRYCDTPYAYHEGEEKSLDEIISAVSAYQTNVVEITGGEPLLQEDCPLLMERLIQKGYQVLIETNGSQDIRRLPRESVCILDMKCPSSDMSEYMDFNNLHHLRSRDEVKFVIQNREDYMWAKTVMSGYLSPFSRKVWLSPAHPAMDPRELADWLLADGIPAHLHLPLHRILWPEINRAK